jgi:hypothetical protein
MAASMFSTRQWRRYRRDIFSPHTRRVRTVKRLAVLAVILALALPAAADWDPSMSSKWVQFPDLDFTGIDVNATTPYILADDFLCTTTGPITDIHVWGSWYQDYLPAGEPGAVDFILSIHGDIPDSMSTTGYSMPDTVLWWKRFSGAAGDFTVQVWQSDLIEGWMDPPEYYEPVGDHVCWQYNFFIDEADAFVQQGSPDQPMVYWLNVQAIPLDEAYFGWKTSVDHWNDDAVFGYGEEPYPGPWDELVYPPGHEWYPQSIDLAFVITTTEQTDELDWGDAPDGPYPTLAGSFPAGASHLIVPGVQIGPSIDSEPDGQPTSDASGDDTDGNDDEDGVTFLTPFVPGTTAQVDVNASVAGFLDAWIDWNADGSWTGEQVCTAYPLAIGPNTVNIPVPASAIPGTVTFARFRFSTYGGLPEYGPATDGEIEDYEVYIEEEGEPYKWIQKPDLDDTGIDINATEEYILADDFLCMEPGRITEIYVWGSWLDDYPPYEDPGRVAFTLSIHEDIPASAGGPDYSMPGDILWHRDFAPGEFNVEIWQDEISEGWMDPPDNYFFPGDTICWLYTFFIDPREAFHQVGMPDSNIVYWLDVQAHPEEFGALFGWKTSLDHWNDDAVWGVGFEPYFGPWYELRYPPNHALYPQSIDLAFAIRSTYGTGIDDGTVGERSSLRQNVPNPFNPKTTIQYVVPAGGCDVKIDIYDVAGHLVRRLTDGFETEGEHEIVWDGRSDDGRWLPTGVYLYRLATPAETLTRKMLLLK